MRAPLLAAAALLATPAAAHADATITALPRDRYDPAELTIDAGERVTFANRDISVHDVSGDGFRTAHTDPGRDSPVTGAERLAPGRYAFACSLHPYMTGALVVRGEAGAPPPPEQPPEQPPREGPQRDTTPPRLKLRVRARVARMSVDEAATLSLRARGRAFTKRTAGAATIRFRLPRGTRRIVVIATDAAGNRVRVYRRTGR